LLDTYKFERWAAASILRTDFYDFSNALHERIEVLGLRVATAQGWNRSHVVAIFIAVNHHRERP
jgi:hypothetical protein